MLAAAPKSFRSRRRVGIRRQNHFRYGYVRFALQQPDLLRVRLLRVRQHGPGSTVGGEKIIGGGAVNAEIRMGRLEAQMRDLTGRVEEFINQIEQVRQHVAQMASDIEERVSQAPGAGPGPAVNLAPTRPGSAAPARPTRQLAAEPPRGPDEDFPSRQGSAVATGPAIPPGTAVPPPGGAPVFGTLTPPGALSAGPDVASVAPPGRPAAGGLLSGGSAAEQRRCSAPNDSAHYRKRRWYRCSSSRA